MLTHYLIQMEISLRSVRDSTLTLTLLNLFLLLHGVSSDTEFEISVPTGVQMGVYGEAVHLSCVFPVNGSWDADRIMIMWQHNQEVVHSFFHGQDQPQYQSRRYANRTSLFHQEMKKGNASLRLDRTTLEDVGEYTCSVSTPLGWQRKSFPLKVAAFYYEPRLQISVLSDGHMEVLVTSEGGFPSPSLQWLMGNTRDVTNHTHTQLSKDHHTGLYSVNSKLILNGTVNSSITFIMKNPDLDQTIRRSIDLFSENGPIDQREQRAGPIVFSVVVVILLAVIISLIILQHQMMKKEKSRNPSESTIESSEALIHQTAAEKPLMDESESVSELLDEGRSRARQLDKKKKCSLFIRIYLED
ncbi:CD276 antigen-like isoform X1 [Tachysurus vachellii]|uniref:CD276 antigen-like isoform X1 n=1 Tax=Tachysurus vachellii TaxID=175792 RepID=UPI00296B288C|nr:CD276 antigen-like isoform X1 [Tachysurus vachellii]XP_060727649.1 CD276 antigen-like isoform X1 [Tachysurus vachellii]